MFHAQGKKLWKCDNIQQLALAADRAGQGWYASQLINKTAEYRVLVAQGRAVWVVKKIPANPQAIAWNVNQGGRFENISWDNWPLKVVKTAIQAWKLSGLDFGGVDIMEDADGKCYVLEINSAPSQTSPYRQQCMAKVFDWIVEHNSCKEIPLPEEKGGYRKFIHPAISQDARLGA
jgi:glutathione synthase/RimK-type ligase-like ATP-grasp enzyme